jgi:hypothetical protein
MRILTSILGLLAGLVLAILFCVPLYSLLWPRATDKNQGGPGYFLVLMLAPTCMFVGLIVGAIAGGRISKHR